MKEKGRIRLSTGARRMAPKEPSPEKLARSAERVLETPDQGVVARLKTLGMPDKGGVARLKSWERLTKAELSGLKKRSFLKEEAQSKGRYESLLDSRPSPPSLLVLDSLCKILRCLPPQV